MGILDRFQVILLDMNGTFMFGQDRFGPGEDFAATYRTFGGVALADADVERVVRTTHASMASDYQNPARYDDFPQVADVLRSLNPTLPHDERDRIEEVIAVHELGQVRKPTPSACSGWHGRTGSAWWRTSGARRIAGLTN